jgi:hypothetical protein
MATKADETIDIEEPLRGVVVLAREDFERNLVQAFGNDADSWNRRDDELLAVGYRVDDETLLRATELAGRANEPGVVGVVALSDKRMSGSFSGNLFIVADRMETDSGSDRLLVTEFDVVAVELTGRAAWVGGDARLAIGQTPSGLPGVSQPNRCCGPSTICIPTDPAPDPMNPIFRYSLGARVAVVRAPSQPTEIQYGSRVSGLSSGPGGVREDAFGQTRVPRVGDYRTRQDEGRPPVRVAVMDAYSLGNKAVPKGLRWPDGVPRPQILDCMRVVDKGCTTKLPTCDQGMTGFTPGNDGDVTIGVGSNPCDAGTSRPVHQREVPEWCTYIFAPECLPSACGGVSDTMNTPWGSKHTLPKFCGIALVAPGSNGPCNPVSEAVLDFQLKQAAGWLPGKASSRCEPLGPRSRGAEHCVSCDDAGNCSESVVRPKVDPMIATEGVEKSKNDGGSSSDLDLIDVIVGIAKAIASKVSAFFSGSGTGSQKAPDPKAPAATAPPAPSTSGTKPSGAGKTGSANPRGPFAPGTDPLDVVNRSAKMADPVDLSDGGYRIDHIDLQFPGPARSLLLSRT